MSARFDYVYRAYRYRFRVDPAEIRFVRRYLSAGQVAVDIGCHKGAYTYWMRRCVGPSGVVYSFEPQPGQVAYLRSAFTAMHYENVVLAPLAVSDTCGHLPLYMSSKSTHDATLEARCDAKVGPPSRGGPVSAARPSAPTNSALNVDVTTLDDFFARCNHMPHAVGATCPHFLKIDVEGHELSVLKGAQRTLESCRPAILIECEARHRADGDVRPVFDFLESLGYTGSFFCHGGRQPLVEFDPSVHQCLDPDSDRLPPGYVNNFAFT